MNDHDTHLASLDVDEAWIVDWATEGILAIERISPNTPRSGISFAPATT